jgi:hypothetical protein
VTPVTSDVRNETKDSYSKKKHLNLFTSVLWWEKRNKYSLEQEVVQENIIEENVSFKFSYPVAVTVDL